MKNNSFQRVMALTMQDVLHSPIWFLWVMYALHQFFSSISYVRYINWLFENGHGLKVGKLSSLYGTYNHPVNSLYLIFLVGFMCLMAYMKFSNKRTSSAYRLLPATAGEKCMNLWADLLVLLAGCYAIKLVSCLFYGLVVGDLHYGLLAIQGMFVDHLPGLTADVLGTNFSYAPEGALYSNNLWGVYETGVPTNPYRFNDSTNPYIVESVMPYISTTMFGTSNRFLTYHPLWIADWSAYPLLAFGLKMVGFLQTTLWVTVVATAFFIRKTGKRFFSTWEGRALMYVLIYICVLFFLHSFDLDLQWFTRPIDYAIAIFRGEGPWCWMSMEGWMVQSAILLVFNVMAAAWLHYKIKNI